MSKKHFSWLLVLTIVVAAVAFLMPSETARENRVAHQPVLPGLEDRVNDIDWLRIGSGGETVATLVRRDGQWSVEEAGGYRADWPQLQQLLSGLASATVLEAKTANPEYYERLGVQDPAQPGASGILVEFAEEAGLPAVIVGNRAGGRSGQYLRLAGSGPSVLIDRELEVPREAEDWLEREVIDISENEVVEVAIQHADGDAVLARKISADDEHFELQGIEDGFEPSSAWSVDSLAGGLSSLRLDAVARDDEIDWSDAVQYRLLTADGLTVDVQLAAVSTAEGETAEHWLRLEAGTRTTAVESGLDEEAAAATAERAAAVNRRVSGWAYRVPQYKYESLSKRREDMVRAVEATE